MGGLAKPSLKLGHNWIITLQSKPDARTSIKNIQQQTSGLIAQMGIQHEIEDWGFESASGQDILFLKNFDTFTRTPIRVSKMNDVAGTQLTFQMLFLL